MVVVVAVAVVVVANCNLTPLFMPFTTLAHGKNIKVKNGEYHFSHLKCGPFFVSSIFCNASWQGKGVAITKAKLKNLLTGALIDKTCLGRNQLENPAGGAAVQGLISG